MNRFGPYAVAQPLRRAAGIAKTSLWTHSLLTELGSRPTTYGYPSRSSPVLRFLKTFAEPITGVDAETLVRMLITPSAYSRCSPGSSQCRTITSVKALLLAAGLGSRLYPLTADRPKGMVELLGQPVLERNVAWLHHHGVDDLVINTHHGADRVVRHFGDGSAFGVRITYSTERHLLGTAGAIRGASHHLGTETFLVVYADNLYSFDLRAMIQEHERARPGRVITLALHWREDASSSGVAVVEPTGILSAFREKPAEPMSGWVNAGVLIVEPDLIRHIPATVPCDLGRDVLPVVLDKGGTIAAHFLTGKGAIRWIDTPSDLERARVALTGVER